MPTPSVGFQFLLPIKPLSFKLPFGQRLEIEIYGRVVSDPPADLERAELRIERDQRHAVYPPSTGMATPVT